MTPGRSATHVSVVLERPCIRHTDAFLDAVRRSRSLHKGLVSPPADAEAFVQYLKSLRRKNRLGFLVMLEDSRKLAGVINVSEIVLGLFQSAYLGYYAFRPHAGHGYMRQGLQQVIRHCFGELRLHRLEANVQPENRRSIELVKSLDFVREGFSPGYLKIGGKWRDHERWAIRSEQWR